jgi:serine/threonine protein kinase
VYYVCVRAHTCVFRQRAMRALNPKTPSPKPQAPSPYPLPPIFTLRCVGPRCCMLRVVQVLQGVRHMHERELVHRDIKAANILLTNHGRCAKLSDFGESQHIKVTLNPKP